MLGHMQACVVSASCSSAAFRLVPPGQDLVELGGQFHTERAQLAIELGEVVIIELVASGSVPEDVTTDVLKIEVNNHETVVKIDPDG
jgi:hypothetical protein